MIFYEITHADKELITSALKTLEKNFDDGIYNQDLLPFAWKHVVVND